MNHLTIQAESIQFGHYLLSQDLIGKRELEMAFEINRSRPLMHLGEIFVLMGIFDEMMLCQTLRSFEREGRLGGLLIARGKLTVEELATVLDLQASQDRPLGELLVELNMVSPEEIAEVLREQPASPTPTGDIYDKLTRDRQVNFFLQAEADGLYPYFKPIQAAETARTRIDDREVVLLAANSYLGLSDDPAVAEASIQATRRYGTGTSGSPLLNGTMDLHVQLERQLATFMGKPACLLMSTGFQTNLGVLSTLVGRGDVVIVDALAHASIHDGCRLSYAEVKRFHHNDMAHLEQQLKWAGDRPKLIVIDGVYSMDGDLADLPNIVRLARAYSARILLDDAHGFGALGLNGRGTAEYFRLMEQVDIITLTFSKSLGTIGGCVLASSEVIKYLKHRSRPFIFSATLPPGTVAATQAALHRIMTDPGLRQRLERNIRFMRQGLFDRGFLVGGTQSQILPVLIGDDQKALQMGVELLKEGVFVATVVSPGVPPGQARLRVSMMASHTLEDLTFALDAFERVAVRIGLIEPVSTARKVIPAAATVKVPVTP